MSAKTDLVEQAVTFLLEAVLSVSKAGYMFLQAKLHEVRIDADGLY